MKTTINKLKNSEIEIIGSLEFVEFAKFENKALERLGGRLELPGFRKGKAPVAMVKENTNEMVLLEEMAELALQENYIKIIEENKLDAIGRPHISITKIGKGSDLEFKIVTAVLPEMKLPDYKKIAKDQVSKDENKVNVIVNETEVEKVIKDLRKMRAEQNRETHIHEDGEDEELNKAHHVEVPESDYPLFDDELAKSFGEFKTADELREKIKSNLRIEKETEQKDKVRLLIVEDLVKQTEGEIPQILIEGETDKIMFRLQADITNAGLKFEDYLKQINKTEADLRLEWKGEAEKRAKLQMIIYKISELENLKPTEEEIEADVVKIMEMYKDADKGRARAYVEQMMGNERVFSFLEKQ